MPHVPDQAVAAREEGRERACDVRPIHPAQERGRGPPCQEGGEADCGPDQANRAMELLQIDIVGPIRQGRVVSIDFAQGNHSQRALLLREDHPQHGALGAGNLPQPVDDMHHALRCFRLGHPHHHPLFVATIAPKNVGSIPVARRDRKPSQNARLA